MPANAQPPVTTAIQADPASLGLITDGPAGGACATAPVGRAVTFAGR
jgi:hypothetical protein